MNGHSDPPPSPHPPSRFSQFCYRCYVLGERWHHWRDLHFSYKAWTFAAILLLSWCLLIVDPYPATFCFFSSIAALFLIACCHCLFRRTPSCSATRTLPKYGTAGSWLRYQATLTNASSRAISHFLLLDSAPHPVPSATQFFSCPEPDEASRNPFDRLWLYYRWRWLVACLRQFSAKPSSASLTLPPHQSVSIPLEILPLRRGVISLQQLTLILPDALGFFNHCHSIAAPAQSLIILPKRYPLPPLYLPGASSFHIQGNTSNHATGMSGEFVSLRPYRAGDPLKLIHWKSWARLGFPIVTELEEASFSRYALILDTQLDHESPSVFEEAVSIAASFAVSIHTDRSLLDLMFINHHVHHVTAGRGLERTDKLLEVLAGVNPDSQVNFPLLIQKILSFREQLASCLIILVGWCPKRRALLEQLQVAGIICLPVLVSSTPPADDFYGHWIDANDVTPHLNSLIHSLPS